MVIEKLLTLFGREVVEGFGSTCTCVLAEAAARAEQPIDGAGVHIRSEERLRIAAAGLLVSCGFLRKVDEGIFIITELGFQANDRLEKSYSKER